MVGPVTLTEYTATLLNNGMVLVAGGVNPLNGQLAPTAELYNPSSMTFTLTGNMNFARAVHAASLLNDGMVLIEGGGPGSQTSAELYDPLSGTFRVTGSLNAGREQHTSTLLSNGSVLVAGGFGASSVLTSAELYGPATLVPANLVSISVSPVNPSISPGAFQAFTATGTFGDGSTQTLSSVTWSSSNNAVVTVTNDSTDRGVVFGLTIGTATLNACTGVICGSTTVTVNPPSPSITGLTPNSAPAGANVAIIGANFGEVQGPNSVVTFNGVVAPVSQWSPSSITAVVPFGATTGNVTVSVSGETSNGWSFTVVPALVSLAVQPAIPGMIVGGNQQFSAVGTFSDGSTQDLTASANWSSYNPGIASVNSSGLVTAVSSGIASITASVGSASATVALNVATAATPPSIAVQAYPPANSNGWNDSVVLVAFTCTAGSSNVISCPIPQTVTTEGTNQIVSGTVTDSVGASASTTVALNIEKTPPSLVVSYPPDQSALSSSTLTATGSLVSSITAISSVTCNGVAATFDSGSFSCNVGLSPGLNLLSIIARDVAGNATGTQLHVTGPGALPAPTSLQITPTAPFLYVGNTQQFTAGDQLGHPRTDATWTVDNTSIATISTDSSPILTGIAAGQVTLTASVGSVSAQAQVTVVSSGVSLQVGSIVWSSPGISGTTGLQVIPVLSSGEGSADVVSLDSATPGLPGSYSLRAFTSDGRQAWQTSISASQLGDTGIYSNDYAVAFGDNSGGVIVSGSQNFADIDGATGSTAWVSDLPVPRLGSRMSQGAVGPDGSVYAMYYDSEVQFPELLRIDANSGHATPIVMLSPNTFMAPMYPGVSLPGGYFWAPPMFAPDGSLYAEYVDYSGAQPVGYLLQVSPDGASSSLSLGSGFGSGGSIIPDGQGGVLVAWSVGTAPYPTASYYYQVLDTTSGNSYRFVPQFIPGGLTVTSLVLVMGGDGTAYATDGITIWAFDPLSGQVKWTSQPASGVTSIFAVQAGGVFVVDGNFDALQIGSDGTASMIGAPQSVPYIPVVSATGQWYVPLSSNLNTIGGVSQWSLPEAPDPSSLWPEFAGDPLNQNNPTKLKVATFLTKAPGYPGTQNFGSVGTADKYLNLSAPSVSTTFYDIGKTRPATGTNFLVVNGQINPTNGQSSIVYKVVGFIGDSDVISCAVGIPCAPFSSGLLFTDAFLERTPNCDDQNLVALGHCYYLDTVDIPITNPDLCTDPPPVGFLKTAQGCFKVTPPCAAQAVQIGGYCFRFPNVSNSQSAAIVKDSLTTTASIVFIGSCNITDVFKGWWNLAQNGTQALVVPDITAMANAPQNTGLSNKASVDLAQGAIGYQALLNTMANGGKLGDAVTAANKAIADSYSPNNYTVIGQPILPMVVYTFLGNQDLCIRSCKK